MEKIIRVSDHTPIPHVRPSNGVRIPVFPGTFSLTVFPEETDTPTLYYSGPGTYTPPPTSYGGRWKV